MRRGEWGLVVFACLALLIYGAAIAPPLTAQIAAGTVNAKQSGTWNVTNVSGTVSLPTGASTETSLAKLTIAQGAALGTNTVVLDGGSVTTAAPSYTTGQISPLSLTTAGLLRVDAGASAALTAIVTGQQAVTGTVAVLPTQASKRVCIKVLTAGTQTVYFGPTGTTTATGQELSAGDAWCGPLDNVNRLFVIAATTGSTVAWESLN